MDRNWFSRIAHGNLLLWNPVSLEHLQTYVARLGLQEESHVLDIGCGRGHLLKLVLSQYAALCTGIDASPYAMAQAKLDLAEFIAGGRLTLMAQPFEESGIEAAAFHLVVCLGSTHVVGGYRALLKIGQRLLKPGGHLLIGEGYWKHQPSPEYLAFLQMSQEDHTTHGGNLRLARNEGYEIVASSKCSEPEWDAYENQYARNVEDYLTANPHDPDAAAMLARIRPWREAYFRWGRETLGFGLYLFRRPRDSVANKVE